MTEGIVKKVLRPFHLKCAFRANSRATTLPARGWYRLPPGMVAGWRWIVAVGCVSAAADAPTALMAGSPARCSLAVDTSAAPHPQVAKCTFAPSQTSHPTVLELPRTERVGTHCGQRP